MQPFGAADEDLHPLIQILHNSVHLRRGRLAVTGILLLVAIRRGKRLPGAGSGVLSKRRLRRYSTRLITASFNVPLYATRVVNAMCMRVAVPSSCSGRQQAAAPVPFAQVAPAAIVEMLAFPLAALIVLRVDRWRLGR